MPHNLVQGHDLRHYDVRIFLLVTNFYPHLGNLLQVGYNFRTRDRLVTDDFGLGHHNDTVLALNLLYPKSFLNCSHLRVTLDDFDFGLIFLRLHRGIKASNINTKLICNYN